MIQMSKENNATNKPTLYPWKVSNAPKFLSSIWILFMGSSQNLVNFNGESVIHFCHTTTNYSAKYQLSLTYCILHGVSVAVTVCLLNRASNYTQFCLLLLKKWLSLSVRRICRDFSLHLLIKAICKQSKIFWES